MVVCNLLAPSPLLASLTLCGTVRNAVLAAITIVGSVSIPSVMPPTKLALLGNPIKLINNARPNKPYTILGTAAKLLMFISIKSLYRFQPFPLGCGNSSMCTAQPTPIGNANNNANPIV